MVDKSVNNESVWTSSIPETSVVHFPDGHQDTLSLVNVDHSAEHTAMVENSVNNESVWTSSIPENSTVHFPDGRKDALSLVSVDPSAERPTMIEKSVNEKSVCTWSTPETSGVDLPDGHCDALPLVSGDSSRSVFIIDPLVETVPMPDDNSLLRLKPLQPPLAFRSASSSQEGRRPTQPTPNMTRANSFHSGGRMQQGTAMDPAFSTALLGKLNKASEQHVQPSVKQGSMQVPQDPTTEIFKHVQSSMDTLASFFCCQEVGPDKFPQIIEIACVDDERTPCGQVQTATYY